MNFVTYEMSGWKIKQKVDLVSVFELFSNLDRSNQVDAFLTGIIIAQKSTNHRTW